MVLCWSCERRFPKKELRALEQPFGEELAGLCPGCRVQCGCCADFLAKEDGDYEEHMNRPQKDGGPCPKPGCDWQVLCMSCREALEEQYSGVHDPEEIGRDYDPSCNCCECWLKRHSLAEEKGLPLQTDLFPKCATDGCVHHMDASEVVTVGDSDHCHQCAYYCSVCNAGCLRDGDEHRCGEGSSKRKREDDTGIEPSPKRPCLSPEFLCNACGETLTLETRIEAADNQNYIREDGLRWDDETPQYYCPDCVKPCASCADKGMTVVHWTEEYISKVPHKCGGKCEYDGKLICEICKEGEDRCWTHEDS